MVLNRKSGGACSTIALNQRKEIKLFLLAKLYELFSVVVGFEVTILAPGADSFVSVFGVVDVQL